MVGDKTLYSRVIVPTLMVCEKLCVTKLIAVLQLTDAFYSCGCFVASSCSGKLNDCVCTMHLKYLVLFTFIRFLSGKTQETTASTAFLLLLLQVKKIDA